MKNEPIRYTTPPGDRSYEKYDIIRSRNSTDRKQNNLKKKTKTKKWFTKRYKKIEYWSTRTSLKTAAFYTRKTTS